MYINTWNNHKIDTEKLLHQKLSVIVFYMTINIKENKLKNEPEFYSLKWEIDFGKINLNHDIVF